MQTAASPKIEITFSPTWWYHKYGMDFEAAKTWHDPFTAIEWDQQQRRLLWERFGDAGLGEADPQPIPIVGGEFGHRWMSALWGCEVAYFPDQWPHAVPLPNASQRMQSLDLPDLGKSPVVQMLNQNASLVEDKFGTCQVIINFGGPLNNAVSVFGEEIFSACAGEPELAQRVLFRMGEAVLMVFDDVQSWLNHESVQEARAKPWELGNCPVSQISPRMYRQVVLPIDLWLRSHFSGVFNLHHCGVFHPYAEVYRPLNFQGLDAGPGTDLAATRAAYPRVRLSTYMDPSVLMDIDGETVDLLVSGMIRDAGPRDLFTHLRVVEIGPEISDDTVRQLMTVSSRIG